MWESLRGGELAEGPVTRTENTPEAGGSAHSCIGDTSRPWAGNSVSPCTEFDTLSLSPFSTPQREQTCFVQGGLGLV